MSCSSGEFYVMPAYRVPHDGMTTGKATDDLPNSSLPMFLAPPTLEQAVLLQVVSSLLHLETLESPASVSSCDEPNPAMRNHYTCAACGKPRLSHHGSMFLVNWRATPAAGVTLAWTCHLQMAMSTASDVEWLEGPRNGLLAR